MSTRFVKKIGDVYCAEFDDFKRFFQYIENDRTGLKSPVIRVFKRLYPLEYSPVIDDIVADEVDFYAHTILKFGVENEAWYKVGNSTELGLEGLEEVIFGHTNDMGTDFRNNLISVNPLNHWIIKRVNQESKEIGRLPEKYYDKTEIGGVLSYIDICNRMKYGYYKYTMPMFSILKRVPLPDVDSYTKMVDDGIKTTIYHHFHGDKPVRQVIVLPEQTIRLTEEQPEADMPDWLMKHIDECRRQNANILVKLCRCIMSVFHNKKAESENKAAGRKIRLFVGKFGDVNWRYDQFIEKEEFEAAWVRL